MASDCPDLMCALGAARRGSLRMTEKYFNSKLETRRLDGQRGRVEPFLKVKVAHHQHLWRLSAEGRDEALFKVRIKYHFFYTGLLRVSGRRKLFCSPS